MRILLIAGGWSNEREVSLSGAKAIDQALQALGHSVCFFDPALSFAQLPGTAKDFDFAFINLHGSPGEDGLIQAVLDQAGLPYQGSGPRESLLALNKAASKSLFEKASIATPAWEFLPVRPQADWRPSLAFPFVLKPNSGGSSLNIHLIDSQAELDREMAPAFSRGDEILLEERIQGLEITCGVLRDEPLPPILIQPADDSAFFDYFSKYTPGAARETCPAPISRELTKTIQDLALAVHKLLGLSGYSRTDFILANDRPFVLEVNTLPGMTRTSLIPQEAAAHGYSFQDLIRILIETGLLRHGQKGSR
ncbi:MAG: D-alanine--D-alanine ligase family protein [Thermodesulfobacteriota bacterium]